MRVIFADGTKSHFAVRAVVVADTRGQLRVLDMDTVAELVDMLTGSLDPGSVGS